MALSKDVEAGQAIYSRLVLSIYDFYVLGISNHLIWHCPTSRLIEHYNRHTSGNHLDVGVGTGFLLDHCRFPVPNPAITLLDLNQNSLDVTTKRIGRYRPGRIHHNIFEALPAEGHGFDSIGINYLLHCLPGTMASKAVVFDNLLAVLNDEGIVFGSTLVQGNAETGWPARKLMQIYNRKGIFSNRHDTIEELEKILASRFSNYNVELVGCAAIFSAHK